MCEEHSTHGEGSFTGKLLVGLVLMALGVIFFLHNLGVLDAEYALRFWPLVLVLIALSRFWRRGFLSLSGHILLLLGIGLQIANFERYSLLERAWPLGLVWLGVILVLRALFPGACSNRRAF